MDESIVALRPLVSARAYLAAGLSVLPIRLNGSKSPVIGWGPYQRRRPTENELAVWFSRSAGIGIVCGRVSGGLEVLDFDAPGSYDAWAELASASELSWIKELPLVSTGKEHGRHLYFRSEACQPGQILARTAESNLAIELRGEGQYVIAPGSPAAVHISGREYRRIAGVPIEKVPRVTPEQRRTLLELARGLNRHVERARLVDCPSAGRNDEYLPGSDYNLRGSWVELLERHGWTSVRSNDAGHGHWRRPGKSNGVSATLGYCKASDGTPLLYVFSTSARPLAAGRAYTLFAAFTNLEHQGDFRAAASTLRARGFGGKTAPRPPDIFDSEGTAERTIPTVLSGDNVPSERREFRLSDLGNAERLIADHGQDIRYLNAWGQWLIWNGQRWRRDERQEIVKRACETVRAMYMEAFAIENDQRRRELIQHAQRSEKLERILAMVRLAQSIAPIGVGELDRDPWLLNVKNGTLELKTGRLRPHCRDDYISKCCAVEYREMIFAPWNTFIREVTGGDEAFVAFLQRLAGYALTGVTIEEKLFFLHGPGASGKSTFLEAVRSAMGDYATTADFEVFLKHNHGGAPRNDIARLVGARLVVASEVEVGKRLAEGLVKSLTGGDTVTARFLYKEFFEFVPCFKLCLSANHAPAIDDQDEAMWRRLVRVPFERVVPEERRDPTLKSRLKDEEAAGPAVLHWALQGCLDWQRDGIGLPPVVKDATASLRADMDPLREFLSDCCVTGSDRWSTAADLWAAFQNWNSDRGDGRTLNRGDFARRLSDRGFKSGRWGHGRERIWRGVGLGGLDADARTRADVSSGISPSRAKDRELSETCVRPRPHVRIDTHPAATPECEAGNGETQP